MPYVIVAVALATFGLLKRESVTVNHAREVVSASQVRMAAVADPACQDSLRFAPNDSVRASIVDGCVSRLVLRNSVSATPVTQAGTPSKP
jgi:hypothetical protein